MSFDGIAAATDLAREVPLFADLDSTEIHHLFSGFRPFTIPPGQLLMEQGKGADGVYFLRSGHADIIKILPGAARL